MYVFVCRGIGCHGSVRLELGLGLRLGLGLGLELRLRVDQVGDDEQRYRC